MSTAIGSPPKAVDWNIESLAPELLLNIVTRLPDLLSLDLLIRASPSAFRLFDQCAVEITEAILSNGVTHPHIQVIIRINALIRSSTLPIKNLNEFLFNVTHHTMLFRLQRGGRRCYRADFSYDWFPYQYHPGLVPQRLHDNTTPTVLRSILATNRLIMCHAFECLDGYLAGFIALRPKHVVNPCKGDKVPIENFLPDGVLGAKSECFERVDSGPPSWVRGILLLLISTAPEIYLSFKVHEMFPAELKKCL